ncbi:MAG: isopenicillin N synthase family oxygenase, partial [Acidimicrobiaceae bacterium]|nr:isopenicillin N synthase family oxygenase [Acidimicrobiaceae bacterium]
MEILDVDLVAFERGNQAQRAAVVDGVMRSLATGFVYVAHDLGAGVIDEAYGQLEAFFGLPQDRKDRYIVAGSHGQTGYTPMMTETAAISD